MRSPTTAGMAYLCSQEDGSGDRVQGIVVVDQMERTLSPAPGLVSALSRRAACAKKRYIGSDHRLFARPRCFSLPAVRSADISSISSGLVCIHLQKPMIDDIEEEWSYIRLSARSTPIIPRSPSVTPRRAPEHRSDHDVTTTPLHSHDESQSRPLTSRPLTPVISDKHF